MKNIFKAVALLSLICISCSSPKSKFVDLFNGKDFTGFVQLNGQAEFKVEDGVMVGVSTMKEPNSFLATEQTYGDFILEFDVMCDVGLNSGVQFRSLSTPDYRDGRVHGYQCEIDTSDRAWSGGIYDEARNGWLAPLDMNPDGQKAYKNGEWNHYRIEALADTMRVLVNGINTANIVDNTTPEGFIAFQVHSIGTNEKYAGKVIKWKNIKILTEDVEANLTKDKLAHIFNLIPNTLTEQEVNEGWELLFDGKSRESLEALWRNDNKETFPAEGWSVEDGALMLAASNGKEWETYGNIITKKCYSAFEFSVEFKLTEGANSGIKYFTIEESLGDRPSCFGLEYQLLDNAKHPDANLFTSVEGSRKLAGLYDMKAPVKNDRFTGIGKWNRAEIVAYPDGRVIHYMNGTKMLEYQRDSQEFKDMIAGSKYKNKAFNLGKYPFGTAPEGHILLQDHGNLVYFRSIKIKDLSE